MPIDYKLSKIIIRNFRGVDSLEIDLRDGFPTLLIGSNNAGKSTILKTVSGLIRPKTGKIEFLGQDITKAEPHAIVRRGIAFIILGDQSFKGYPASFSWFGQCYVWWVISFELVLFLVAAGFLMGVFTILASALITGGVGPWLPYQMLTAGWVGMSAGWLRALGLPGAREGRLGRVEHALLSAAGFSWGLLFGAITNLYFWPYAQGPVSQTWSAGLSLGETLARFGAFYAATSLPWDMARAVGNVALLLPLAVPTVRALTRFRRRFRFQAGPPGAIEGVRADA